MSSATIVGRRCAFGRILRPFAAACLAACAAWSSRAATPVAVWDGDFAGADTTAGAVRGLFAMRTTDGGTVSGDKSYVTVGEGAGKTGVLVDWDSSVATSETGFKNKAITILVRYANLEDASYIQTLSTLWTSTTGAETTAAYRDRVGFLADQKSVNPQHKSYGIYQGAVRNQGQTRAGVPCETSSATNSMAVTYAASAGYAAYFRTGSETAFTAKYSDSALKQSTEYIYGATVGGTRMTPSTSNWQAAKRMKILKVAVFNTVLTADEMAAYKFPSEREYASVLSLNFGASSYNVPALTDPGAIVDDNNWYNLNGNNITNAAAGTAFVTYGGSGNYRNESKVPVYLKGYLDDNGKTVNIAITNLSGLTYDVYIYCNTDSGDGWPYKTVNGVNYTALANGEATPGTASWGDNGATYSVLGSNVMVVRGVVPSADGSITISSARNGSKRGCIAALQLGERKVHTAEIDGDAQFSTLDWNPAKPAGGFTPVDDLVVTNAESATLTFDAPVTAGVLKVVNAAGHALKMAVQKPLGIANYDFSQAHGGITFDASGLDGEALAKNTAAGAPYTHWIVRGVVLGGESVAVSMPVLPAGYGAEKVADKYGVRLVVTAPSWAKFGTASINVTPETSNDLAANAYYGLCPEAGANWGFVRNADAVTWKGVSFTPYTSDATPFSTENGVNAGLSDPTRIMRGLGKDISEDRTIGFDVTGVENLVGANGKCRVIVYMSTDSANIYFAPVVINGVVYAGPTEGQDKMGYTIKGSTATRWGATASAGNTHPVTEGVNAVVSDVIDAGDISIRSTRTYNKYSTRASIAAVQVVKVGEVLEGYEVGINDLGKFRIPEGKTWDEVRLFDKYGNAVAITRHDDKYVYFDWKITDDACWWDYEFNGNVNNAGSDGVSLSWDNPHPYAGNEYLTNVVDVTTNVLLRIPSRPWRSVASWPNSATFVMYGTMVSSNKTYQIGFGSTYTGTKYTIFLATEDVAKGIVSLCLSYEKRAPTILCTMTVPNAQTSNHLYAFVLTQKGGKTVVDTYLDGELLQPYTHEEGLVSLGQGFQLGSGFGGLASGYDNAKEGDPALIDWLRVYDCELSAEAMREYAKKYPYVSPNGSYQRDASGTGNWDSADAWKKEGTSIATNVPAAGATVKIDVDGDSSLAANLPADVAYEALQISGDGTLTIGRAAGYGGKVRSSGRVTVSSDVVFGYDACSIAGAPLTVRDGKTVTFDMTTIPLGDIWVDTTYDLSGLVTTGADVRISCAYGEVPAGRTVSYGIDPADQHFKFWVRIKEGGLYADLLGSKNFADLVWKVGDDVVKPDWTKTVVGTIHVKADNPTLTFASALASDDSRLLFDSSNRVTLAAGGSVTGLTYDFTGLGGNRVMFSYKPEMAKVKAQYVRYNIDMGELTIAADMPLDGTYEFLKATLNGVAGQGGRVVRVPSGDVLTLKSANADVRASVSLDVCGGTVYLASKSNASVWYGDGTTRFDMSSGTVYARATGQGQTGSGNGLLLGWSGAPKKFNVSGGLLDVSGSSINFWSATVTNNLSGGTIRAKGVFGGGSPGAINVTGGTFEIGSLGVTTNATRAFILNGGTLSGFEAGASFANAITVGGDAALASAEGASLLVNGEVTGSGTLAIAKGTVKLGKANGLGTLPVAVKDGATLDFAGYGPVNAVTIAGTGVGGAGALVNTGDEVTYKASLALAGDATVGGPISFKQGSAVNLGGHALTVAGRVKLGGFTVGGGGRVVVGSGGTLASNGATSLGDADLEVGKGGTLDLSGGNHVSCRDFASAGTVTGAGATLIVNGTFDATSAISVPKLTLKAATLKGVGLTVANALAMTGKLHVEVADALMTNVIKIATVPESKSSVAIEDRFPYVNGSTEYALRHRGTSLEAVKGSVVGADVAIDSVQGSTNFEGLDVKGTVSDFAGSASGRTNVNIVVKSEDGSTTTHSFAYVGGEGGTFQHVIEGLDPGKSYDVSAYLTIEGAEVHAVSTTSDAFTARPVDGWILENWKTFAGVETGSGVWYGTNGVAYASASNEVICLYAEDWTRDAEFQPAHMRLDLEYSCVKDLHFHVVYKCPGFFTYEPYPIVQDGVSAAFTLVADDEDNLCFAVVSGGGWEIVPREVFAPEIGVAYDVLVRLDGVAENVQYSVISGDGVTRLATCPAKEGTKDVSLDLAGSGDVALIQGVGQNAHLAEVDGEQYWTIGDAIDAANGTTNSVMPLWWSRYVVDRDGGAFRLWDPNGYLKDNLIWQKWHHRSFEDGYWRWISGNNWIEYANETGVVKNANGTLLVTNEFGLAWIAEQATNRWFCGDVSVGADLDLSSKNWTPIAQFGGSFDGRGYTIRGLNNSHVIYTNLLGAAGYYFGGPTNDWNYTAYGLFGSATNASFANVAFEDVAISNVADSAAVLLGVHAGGDLSIRNVEVVSGRVQGEGRAVAGIVTVGGNEELLGDIVVANTTNRATIAGTIGDGLDGGNVAQILAGTSWDAVFEGNVVATNNVGEGEFDVRVVYDLDVPETNDWYESWYNWLDLPVCNFAPAVVRTDENLDFWRFVEANDPASIPIDPLYRTARMLAGKFSNGDDNFSGWWMDTITAGGTGTVVTIAGTNNTLDVWTTVFVDRDVTIDLNTNCVYGLYDCDVFSVAPGKKLTLRNGVIYYAHGYNPTNGWVALDGSVKMAEIPGETFYDRTVPISGLKVVEEYVTIVIPYTSTGFYYAVDSTPTLAEDWTLAAYEPGNGGTLAIKVKSAGNSGFYRVRITDVEPESDESPED